VLAAAGVGFGLGLSGLPFYTSGVFLDPLMLAFHWKAAEVQSGLLVMLWIAALLSPVAGWAVDRFGARIVASLSVLLFSLSFMSLGLTGPDIGRYRLMWGLVGVGGAGTLPLVWGTVVSLHFKAGRGLALGLVLAGSGVTGFLAPPAANALIEAFGWRAAYVSLGALPLVFALPMVWLLLPKGSAAHHETDPAMLKEAERGASVAQALASPQFWLIAIAFMLVAGTAAGCISNLIKILVSHSQPRGAAVGIASVVGLFVIGGRAASGALMDRLWAPGVAAAFLMGPAFGCGLLILQPGSLAAATAAAMLIGLAAGAEFDLLAYLLAAYFGLRRYGAIYGVAAALFSLAGGAGPLLFATVFDAAGSYDPILKASAVAFLISGGGLLLLGKYPTFASAAPERLKPVSRRS